VGRGRPAQQSRAWRWPVRQRVRSTFESQGLTVGVMCVSQLVRATKSRMVENLLSTTHESVSARQLHRLACTCKQVTAPRPRLRGTPETFQESLFVDSHELAW